MALFVPFKTSNDIDLNRLITRTMEIPEVQKELIEYNQSQLQEGIDANGKRIRTIAAEEQGNGQVYSLVTISQKAQKGQPIDKVTLYDSGETYDKMLVEVSENKTSIIIDYDKSNGSILDNFNEGEFEFDGVTKENLDSFLWLVFLDYFITLFLRELEK